MMGRMRWHAALFVLVLASTPLRQKEDLRALYDVQTYRLDLALDPRTRSLEGTVGVEAQVVGPALSRFVLDLQPPFEVRSVMSLSAPIEPEGDWTGVPLTFERQGASLSILLSDGKKKGDLVRLAVAYSGKPKAENSFDGFHWKKTAAGVPWISTSSQGTGSSAWWPCKDSFWHPEDKPERTYVNLTVPENLTGVANGRLTGREKGPEGTEISHWVHEYPCMTYAIAIAAAPFESVEEELTIEGSDEKIPFAYWVVPEVAEKARLQFQDVPRMLEIYTKAFGPFPFPKSKFGLVETSYWGMENSTCIAYGSSFPAWCKANGEVDPYSIQNARFDYILIHESAHEWWGNGVSAKTWGDFWIHEGFATYAEAVYLEELEGYDVAQQHMDTLRTSIGKTSKLFRGEKSDSGQAYAPVIYQKGAWVLHTLRNVVDDDEAWWKTLREFNLAFRYKNASTADFRAVLERNTGKDWKRFFDEWVFGEGYPVITGTVTSKGKTIVLSLRNQGSGKTSFHVPVDLAWKDGNEQKEQRFELEPGANRFEVACRGRPSEVELLRLEGLLVERSILFE
jgi:aminopeptidase N